MRGMTLVLSLIALAARAADAGSVADAGKTAGKPDGGRAAADAGKPAADTVEWKAVPVFAIAENEQALDKFAITKPAERSKIKGLVTKVTVGTRFAAAIFLDGYELPYSRRVDVSADIVITDPEGKEMLDRVSISGAQTMDPKVMLLLPLKPIFGLMFGLTDREGEYRVQITVRDHIRGELTKLDTKFLVTR